MTVLKIFFGSSIRKLQAKNKYLLKSCRRLISQKQSVHNTDHNLHFRSLHTNSLKFEKMTEFIFPNDTRIKVVDCEKAFGALTDKEKLYAHFLSKASFHGGLIVLPQTSLESPLIFVLLHKLFKSQPISELKEIAIQKCKFTEDEFSAMLMYTCGIIGSTGNYKDFGDTKFIPNLPKEKFEELVLASKAAEKEPEKIQSLLSRCLGPIFSLEDHEKQLGFPYIGKTGYISKNFAVEDQDIVKEFFKKHTIEPSNTRLFKTVDEAGVISYEVRLASVLQNDDEEENNLLFSHDVNNHKFTVTRGDYSRLLKIVNEYLLLAKEHTANENEVKMIENYINSFHTGSVDSHKEGSRYWIKNKGPIIETYIGFIESYRDPAGMRAEFEGFVALVDKAMSTKFQSLVDSATKFLPLLPWPAEYERDNFARPDFTSLDILTFAGSGIPVGINIPNYEDICQNEGFKNVSLGNILNTAISKDANFLSKDDQELIEKYFISSSELQIGLHELLGHGSGKLFKTNKDGTPNFNIDKVRHLETNEKISTYYKEGETYKNVFSSLSSPFEECKAECIGIHLCLYPEILKIFGHEDAEAENVVNCNWLENVYSGLLSLKMYEPKTSSWLQAHCQARYAILQVCLEASEDFVKIEEITGSDGKPDLLMTMDYSKIRTVGKNAIANFLRKLQLYQSTADITSAKAMFEKYTAVTSPFLEYRDIVIARKKPRSILVQANTFIEGGKVFLKTYDGSPDGLIQSCIDRFQDHGIYDILEELWAKDKQHF